MKRSTLTRLAAVLVAGALMVAVATAATAAGSDGGSKSGPQATASKSCKVGNDRGYGTTYVRKISATKVSCKGARRLVKKFHKCRPGRKGRCKKKIEGFSCSEKRNVGVGSFDSNVTCKRGGRRVRHSYTQFT